MTDVQNQIALASSQASANNLPTQLSDPICKKCQTPVQQNFYFCPNCGKKMKEPPFRYSWTNTLGNILISLILPPLGIFPGIKHLMINNQKAKILGLLYITLTMIATFIIIKILLDYFNNLNRMLNDIYLLG